MILYLTDPTSDSNHTFERHTQEHAIMAEKHQGYVVSRFKGQTLLFLPFQQILLDQKEDLRTLTKEFYENIPPVKLTTIDLPNCGYNGETTLVNPLKLRSSDEICFFPNVIEMQLPSYFKSPYPWPIQKSSPDHELLTNLMKEKGITAIYPFFNLPNNLVEKINQEFNLSLLEFDHFPKFT